MALGTSTGEVLVILASFPLCAFITVLLPRYTSYGFICDLNHWFKYSSVFACFYILHRCIIFEVLFLMLIPQLLMSSLIHLLSNSVCLLFSIAMLLLSFRLVLWSRHLRRHARDNIASEKINSKQDMHKINIQIEPVSSGANQDQIDKQQFMDSTISHALSRTNLSSVPTPNLSQTNSTTSRASPRIPFVTWGRGETLVLTALAILTIDFAHFQSRLGKCTPSGVSLMDCGAGLIVFVTSWTCAAARPEWTRDSSHSNIRRYHICTYDYRYVNGRHSRLNENVAIEILHLSRDLRDLLAVTMTINKIMYVLLLA